MELAHELLVLAPVAISALVDNSAFLQQALDNQLNSELRALEILDAQRQVLEIYEDSNFWFVIHSGILAGCSGGAVLAASRAGATIPI